MPDPASPAQSSPEDPQNPDPPATTPGSPQTPAKRKRRRWPYVLGGIVLLLFILVALAPTLAGLGPVRSLILNSVNDNLNGHLEVADYSIGWNSGITVDGLKLYEDKEKHTLILQASKVRTQLSLIKALKSGFNEIALGRTDVDNLDLANLRIDEKGELNLAKVAKPSKPKKPSAEPVKISGDIHVNNLTGTVSAANVPQRLRINPSQLAIALTGYDDPIKNDVKLSFVVEDPARPSGGAPATITLVGDADVLDKGKLHIDTAKVKEQLVLANVDLTALNPFLALAKLQLQTAGIANGTVDVNIQGLANAAANGEIKVANFVASGALLKGDQFRSNLTIPLKVTRVMSTKDAAILKIDDLGILTDYGSVTVSADAAVEALQRLARREPPGREGHLSVMVDFTDAKKMADLLGSLRNTLSLSRDVKIDSAKLFAQLDAWLFADSVVTKTQFSVSEVSGSNAGKRVTLEPVTSTLDATYTPTNQEPFNITQLKDVAVVLSSTFAQLNGGTGKGGALTRFNLTGNGDFAKLQQQLVQFADLGKLKLAGTWQLRAATQGDPAKPDVPVAATTEFTADNLAVEGLGSLPRIVQPWLNLSAKGNLFLKDNAPARLRDATLALKTNNPNQPTLNLLAKGNIDLKTFTSDRFDFTLTAALARLREEFGPVVHALNQLESGQVSASGAGSYDGKTLVLASDRPVTVKVTNLDLRRSADAGAPVVLRGQSLDAILAGTVNLAGDQTGADIKAFSVVAPKLLEMKKKDGDLRVVLAHATKKLTGAGGVTLWADFHRLGELSKSFTPPAEGTAAAKDATVAELTRGILDGSLTFTSAANAPTTLAGDFTADLAVRTAKEPIEDKLAITLKSAIPDDLTKELQANLDVKGKVLNASLADGKLLLARQGGDGKTVYNAAVDMLRSAKLTVTADRLELVQALIDSLTPPSPAAVTASAIQPATPRTSRRQPVTGDERISSSSDGRSARRLPEPIPTADTEGEAAKPLPPIKITGGKLALTSTLARTGQTIDFTSNLNLNDLALKRGEGEYQSKDKKITLNLKGQVESAQAAIKQVRIDDASGDLDIGTLKTVKPLVVTNLATTPRIDGAIELEGSLAVLLRAVEMFNAAKPGSQYPYTGYYVLSQQVSTQADLTHLVGSLKASKFKAYNPQNHREAIFSEDLVTLTNDVSADTKSDTLTVKDLSINMQSTGALALSLSDGQLVDWANRRQIADKLQAKLRIDWPKLWTIVRPSLSPDTQKSLADLELAGVMERTFRLEGSFPARGVNKRGQEVVLNTAQSLRSLKAYGGLFFERVALSGVDVRNADLPVALEDGILYLQDATKPKGQRYPKPFQCNNGEIDLGGTQVSLRHTDAEGAISPWITVPDKDKVVLRNVAFNPLLAGSTLGNWINPGFSGAQDARGRVTLTSTECRDVPLDWFTSSKKEGSAARAKGLPPTQSDGRAEFLLAISEMDIKAPLLPFLLKTDKLTGEIKKGKITVENGVVKSDLPMELDDGRMTLAWTGAVNLHDRRILNFNTAIPKQLLADLPVLRNNERFIPNVVNVPISGAFDAPKVDLVAAVTKSLLPGIGGGSGRPEDLIKNLPDLLGGKKDKEKDREKPKGDQPIGREPRSNADDNRRDRAKDTPNDTVDNLVDLAGGLLRGNDKNKKEDKGDQPISSPPKNSRSNK